MWLFKLLNIFNSSGLAGQIKEAYEAKLNAENDSQRISAEIQIATLEERQANRALGGKLTSWVQALWALPFIAYNWKLIIWDKMLEYGVTDPLSESLMTMQLRIATFYFGGAAAIGIVKAFKK